VVKRGESSDTIEVAAPAIDDLPRNAIVANYESMARDYPHHRDLTEYRYKVTWALLALLLAQEVVIYLVRRQFPRGMPILRMLAVPAWLGVGLLVHFVYLR
jgi:hypothetical protein